jgi:predicted metal-binding transcription factor (methanogenesis marker protein 9)
VAEWSRSHLIGGGDARTISFKKCPSTIEGEPRFPLLREEGVTARTISFKEMSERHGGGETLVSPPMGSEPKRGEAERQRDSAGEASDMGGYLSSQKGLAVNQMAFCLRRCKSCPTHKNLPG